MGSARGYEWNPIDFANLRPLEDACAARLADWLPKLNYPIRTGEHSQTAFAFGLVHGFGFAGILGEMDLARERLVPALFGFNLGIELGKIYAQAPPEMAKEMWPRLDGYQTCALIKHHRVFRQTPVVMLSSKDGLFDRARGRVVGSNNYITKPFTREELLSVIEQYSGSNE